MGVELPGIAIPLIKSAGNNGILNLGNGAAAGLLNSYAASDAADDSIASSGAVGSDGAVDLVSTAGGSGIGNTRVELTAILDQLGLGTLADGFVDEVSLELGAFASRAEQTTGSSAIRDYRLADGQLVLQSPAVSGLSAGLTTIVGGVQGTLNAAVGTGGVIDDVVGSANINVTVPLVLQIAAGPGTATATVDVSGIVATLLATPLTSTNGIVTINLGAGTISVDLPKLLKGSGGTDLNTLPANTQLLTPTTINAIVARVADALGGLAESTADLVSAALLGTVLTVTLPATLNVALLTSNPVITVTGTLASFSGIGAPPVISATGNLLGLNLGVLVTGITAPIQGAVIAPLVPVVTALVAGITSGVETSVNNLVQPVITALGPVLDGVLSNIVQLVINEQTEGDLGGFSSTVRALAITVLPNIPSALARVELGSSTVRSGNAVPPLTPTLVATPASVVAGDTVTAAGDGFLPNSAITIVYRDSAGVQIGAAHTGASSGTGGFIDTLVVPVGTPAGPLTVVATDAGSNTAGDSVQVTVAAPPLTPTVVASPGTVVAGDTVTAVGAGFLPNSTITIVYRDSAGVQIGLPHSATTSGTGGFTDTLVVPVGTPAGPLTVVATDAGSNTAGDSVQVTVVVVPLTPTVVASPAMVSAGDTGTAVGTGFLPNSAITIVYRNSAGIEIASHSRMTNGTGGFTDTAVVPVGTPAGPMTAVATDAGGNTAGDSMQVMVPGAPMTPTVVASPGSVNAGGTITAVGGGFLPNATVTIIYRDSAGNQIGVSHARTTDGEGGFIDTLVVPAGTRFGPLSIVAIDGDGNTAGDVVQVVAAAAAAASGARAGLPNTGSTLPLMPIGFAALFMLIGVALLARRELSRRNELESDRLA